MVLLELRAPVRVEVPPLPPLPPPSAIRAAATVFIIAFMGRTCNTTLAHRVQHDIARFHLLQKVHPLIVGRGVLRRASLVFLPCRRRRRGLGAGFVIGSPSLAALVHSGGQRGLA